MFDNRFLPIVLCAGKGTRLRPLTQVIPKPAVPLGDRPIAFRTIQQFFDFGFERVHCNLHYLADVVESELRLACQEFGYDPERLVFWREHELLNTGGGIKRIWQEVSQQHSSAKALDAIVVSGDIDAKVEFSRIITAWETRAAEISSLMVTKALDAPRADVAWVRGFGKDSRVVGFGKDLSEKDGCDARLFTTQQIIGADLLESADLVPESSISLFYRAGLKRGREILNIPLTLGSPWFDIGVYEDYASAVKVTTGHHGCSSPRSVCIVTCSDDDYSLQQVEWPRGYPKTINKARGELLFEELSLQERAYKIVSGIKRKNLEKVTTLRMIHHGSTDKVPRIIISLDYSKLPLAIPAPLLVPLELLESPSLTEGFASGNPYETSQTFFLLSERGRSFR